MANSNNTIFLDEKQEVWKTVPGWYGYDASNFGRVRSWFILGNHDNKLGKVPRLMSLCKDPQRRLKVVLKNSGKCKNYFVHRIILETFVGPCLEGMECRHLDDVPSNNKLENLCWGTRKENMQDSIRNGIQVAEERHPMAKLTRDDISEIRRRYANGESQTKIAKSKGVSQTTIGDICRKDTWKNV